MKMPTRRPAASTMTTAARWLSTMRVTASRDRASGDIRIGSLGASRRTCRSAGRLRACGTHASRDSEYSSWNSLIAATSGGASMLGPGTPGVKASGRVKSGKALAYSGSRVAQAWSGLFPLHSCAVRGVRRSRHPRSADDRLEARCRAMRLSSLMKLTSLRASDAGSSGRGSKARPRSRRDGRRAAVAPSLPSIRRLESHLPAVSAGRQAQPPGHDRYPGRRPRGPWPLLDAPAPPAGQGQDLTADVAAREPLTCCWPDGSDGSRSGSGVARPARRLLVFVASRPPRAGPAHASGSSRSEPEHGRGDARPSAAASGGARRWRAGRSGGARDRRRPRIAARPGGDVSVAIRPRHRGPGWITLHSIVRKEKFG